MKAKNQRPSVRRTMASGIVLAILVYSLLLIIAGRHIFGLSLKKEIDPVSLASLAMTLFVIFFIQYFFFTKTAEFRAEKEFLIEGQKDALDSAKSCRDTVQIAFEAKKITKATQSDVTRAFRVLANSMDAFEEALNCSHCKDLGVNFRVLKRYYYSFKRAATGGSFPASPLTAAAMAAVDREYQRLRRELQNWFFHVNGFR